MGTTFKSTKRAANHLKMKRRYTKVFDGFLGEEGLVSLKKMKAYKVVFLK